MEQAIVMLNAHMILNLSVVKQIVKIGQMIKVVMVLVVLNLIFGKLTNGPMLILPTLAHSQAIIDVMEKNAEMELIDKMEIVTKMVVI